jgi:hypothetical protein
MSRTLIVVIAGLMVAGCVVALLPAEESSRRRASGYKVVPQDSPAKLAPAPEEMQGLPPIVTPEQAGAEAAPVPAAPPTSPPGSFSSDLRASSERATGEYGNAEPAESAAPSVPNELPSSGSPLSPAPLPLSPAAEADALIAEEAEPMPGTIGPATPPGELRSVLKRSARPALIDEAPAPVFQPGSPSDSATSSRRTTSPRSLPRSTTASSRSPAAVSNNEANTGPRSIQDLAISGRSPALRVDVAGPQGITLGKPATYVVSITNESDTAASEVQVRVALPGWVTVASSQTTEGEASVQADAQGEPRMAWFLPMLAGREHAQLRLELVTSQADAFDLGVEWACRSAAAKATIVVKAPQLEVTLVGPATMTFGEEKVFTLAISNPGTGDAEQVVINLSTGDGRSQPIEVGSVPAGHKKEIPLQVVANQAGEMTLHATATGEGGLEAEATGKVLVRKAELNIAVEGPPLKFAGTEAVYLVTISNVGNAVAEDVNLALALPGGAKYVDGIDGASASGGQLRWKVASLPPGSDRQYEVRVQLAAAGLNRLVVQAQASASGSVSGHAETEVEAVSDLKLVVNDPTGPVSTAEHALYEVQVMNRGTQAAEQVKIIVQFSAGIEPVAFEGCQAKLVPGQVLCQPLASLGAGEQVTLRIKAKAETAGAHQFRVEITGADEGTRLVSEGTTRFFTESRTISAAARTATKPAITTAPSGVQR